MAKKFEFIDDPVERTLRDFMSKPDPLKIEDEPFEPELVKEELTPEPTKPILEDQESSNRLHIGGLSQAREQNIQYSVMMRKERLKVKC
jgi:hypothetical protein